MPAASLNVGLIGVRCQLAETLVPALLAQQRFRIASIYDSCYQAARDMAAPLKAKPAPSLVQMLETYDLDGVIILDTDWQRSHPLFMACCQQIPTLFAPQVLTPNRVGSDQFLADQLVSLANEHRTLLMPAYSHRWTPSVLRFQELSVTRIGSIESIEIHTNSSLPEWIDWSCHIAQSNPISVCACESGKTTIAFQRKTQSGSAVTVTFYQQTDRNEATVTCERGKVIVHNDHEISCHESVSEGSCDGQQENLSEERNAITVMLDLFGRRLSGGLMPVPILEDVVRCQQIVDTIQESQQSGETKTLT